METVFEKIIWSHLCELKNKNQKREQLSDCNKKVVQIYTWLYKGHKRKIRCQI